MKNDTEDEAVEATSEPKLKMGFIENIRKLFDSVRMTLFVVGTALTVFVAARNTITWYDFPAYAVLNETLEEVQILSFVLENFSHQYLLPTSKCSRIQRRLVHCSYVLSTISCCE